MMRFYFDSGTPHSEIEHSSYRVEIISDDIEPDYAKAFRTGSNSTGYVLNHIDIKMLTFCIPQQARVDLWSSVNGTPGEHIETLRHTSAGRYTSGRRLAADTEYFIVVHVESNSGISPRTGSTTGTDSANLPQWGVSDVSHVRDHGYQHTIYTYMPEPRVPGPWEGAQSSQHGSVRMAINATAVGGGTMTQGANVTVSRTGSGTVIGPFNARFQFSRDVSGFEADDISVTNGAVQDGSFETVNARTFSATIVPGETGTVQVQVAADRAQSGSRGNTASNVLEVQASVHEASVTLEVIGTPDFSRPITVRATFERAVTGLERNEVSTSGANGVASVQRTGDGTRWNIVINPNPLASELRVHLARNVAQDTAGRGNAPSQMLEVANTSAPEGVLSAVWTNVPASHNRGTFQATFQFNRHITGVSWRNIARSAVRVRNGRVIKARRGIRRSNQQWVLTVRPYTDRDVTMTVVNSTNRDYPLAAHAQATVPGPIKISVNDTSANERGEKVGRNRPDVFLPFVVQLNREAYREVTVDYRTEDISAHAGSDYVARSGTLTFAIGEQVKRVNVEVLDDIIDEGREELRLRLSNPQGATISDAIGIGGIVNDDPFQEAWLSEMGAITGGHVMEALSERLKDPGAEGIRIAGQTVKQDASAEWIAKLEQTGRAQSTRDMDAMEMLLGSSFNVSSGRNP